MTRGGFHLQRSHLQRGFNSPSAYPGECVLSGADGRAVWIKRPFPARSHDSHR